MQAIQNLFGRRGLSGVSCPISLCAAADLIKRSTVAFLLCPYKPRVQHLQRNTAQVNGLIEWAGQSTTYALTGLGSDRNRYGILPYAFCIRMHTIGGAFYFCQVPDCSLCLYPQSSVGSPLMAALLDERGGAEYGNAYVCKTVIRGSSCPEALPFCCGLCLLIKLIPVRV